MICEYCKRESGTRRFCSRRCNGAFNRSRKVMVTCPTCGKTREITEGGARKSKSCASCASDRLSGAGSGTWKGGHHHWSPGRYGRDQDGLSWKVQRRLAWERDNETCQHCKTKKNRKPDVHHIIPFRVSLSHALDNLLCLCQSCHLIEEAKVQEKWGGQLAYPEPVRPLVSCRSRRGVEVRQKIGSLIDAGNSYKEIASAMGMKLKLAEYYILLVKKQRRGHP